MHIIDKLRAFAASDRHNADKAEAQKFVNGIEQHYFELFGKDTLGISEEVKNPEQKVSTPEHEAAHKAVQEGAQGNDGTPTQAPPTVDPAPADKKTADKKGPQKADKSSAS